MTGLCLHHLTLPDVGPAERVRLADEAGFESVSVRLLSPSPGDAAFPLLDDASLARAVAAAVRETGVRVDEVDLVRLPHDAGSDLLPRVVDRAAALGARHLVAAGQSDDAARNLAGFARLCQLAAPHGILVHLEPISWNAVRTLAQAAEVVRAAGQPNGCILVDALHFHRVGETTGSLAALPRSWFRLCHLCDAPSASVLQPDALRAEARTARLLPGEGGLDLVGLLRALPRDITLSVEVPSERLRRDLAPAARALAAKRAAAAVVSRV